MHYHTPGEFEVGDTYQISQPTLDGRKLYKIHVLAIADGCQIVYRWYGKHKQWWHYEIEDAEILAMKIEFCKEWMSDSKTESKY